MKHDYDKALRALENWSDFDLIHRADDDKLCDNVEAIRTAIELARDIQANEKVVVPRNVMEWLTEYWNGEAIDKNEGYEINKYLGNTTTPEKGA